MELFLLVNTESSLSLDSWYANMRDFMILYSNEIMTNPYYANVKALFEKVDGKIIDSSKLQEFLKTKRGLWFDVIFKQD